jgi:hypothetical protein
VVCCSGGGIRSATYCLGALQALAADSELGDVGLVTSVSGGSYTAAAWALAALAADPDPASYSAAYAGAFKPGSVQENRLRDHTHYLVPDTAQGLRGVLSLLWGAVGNLLLVTSICYALLGLDGWLLANLGGVRWPGGAGHTQPQVVLTPFQVWVPAGLGIAAAALFMIGRSRHDERGPRHDARQPGRPADRLAAWTAALLCLAALAAGLLVAGPALFAVSLNVHWIATGMNQTTIGSTAAALSIYAVGLVTIAKGAAGNVSAYWSRLGKGGQGVLRPWLTRVSRLALPWLGSALIAAGLVAWAIYILGVATRPGFPHWHLAAAAGLFLILHVTLDVNRTSLHDFYRDRLVSAYAEPRSAAVRLSQLGGVTPELTICAAANLNPGTIRSGQDRSRLRRVVPAGRGAVSWVFTPSLTGLQFPDAGSSDELAPTAAYETLIGQDRMTLFDLVADSGATGTTLTGKATAAAQRLLLAVVNLRLGVWLPRPALVKLVHNQAMAGRPPRRREWATMLAAEDVDGPPARWWLSWQLTSWQRVYRHRGAAGAGQATRPGSALVAALRWRLWQPNLFLLWHEAARRNPVGRKWIYVTDGGHYDNLGLVAALRRQPRRIIVLDAGGGHATGYPAIGHAIALARSELGVQISIEPGQMDLPDPAADAGGPDAASAAGGARKRGGALAGPRPAEMGQPYAHGTFRYPAGPMKDSPGTITMVKLGVWAGSDLPWDVRAYYEAHPTFPRSGTLQQLYDDRDFEAYRELGAAAVRAMLRSAAADAPDQLADGGGGEPQVAHEPLDHAAAVDRAAAEQVDGDQALLGPRMYAQVGLGEDQHQRDGAVREDDVRRVEDMA